MLSVIIATYNRCISLGNVLSGLLLQEGIPSNTDYEIIVVDNNSTDETKRLVESFMDKGGNRLRYVLEPMRGKWHALNRGVRESRGEILAFTDDDVIIDSKWIYYIYESFKNFSIDAMGGRVLPVYPQSAPLWVKDNAHLLEGPVVQHDYGQGVRRYEGSMVPFVGANMALRRKLFAEEILFKDDLGVGTGRLGEDTEVFNKLRRGNAKILYCGKALVWHPVDERRLSLKYIARWHLAYGRYRAFKEITQGGGILHHGKMFCYLGIDSIWRAVGLMFYVFHRRMFLSHWNSIFTNIGMVVEYGLCFRCRKSDKSGS